MAGQSWCLVLRVKIIRVLGVCKGQRSGEGSFSGENGRGSSQGLCIRVREKRPGLGEKVARFQLCEGLAGGLVRVSVRAFCRDGEVVRELWSSGGVRGQIWGLGLRSVSRPDPERSTRGNHRVPLSGARFPKLRPRTRKAYNIPTQQLRDRKSVV